jgi:hypothetical protein
MKRSNILLGSVGVVLLLTASGALAVGCGGAESAERVAPPALTPELAQSLVVVAATPTESNGAVTLSAVVTVGNGASYALHGSVTAGGHDLTLDDGAGNTFHDVLGASQQEITSGDAAYTHRLLTMGEVTGTLDGGAVPLADALAAAQTGAFGDQPLVGAELRVLSDPATVSGLSASGRALVATALARVSSAVTTFNAPAPSYPSGDSALPPEPAAAQAAPAPQAACTATTTTTASAPPIQPQASPCAHTCNLPGQASASAGAINIDLGGGVKVTGTGPMAQHAATFYNDATLPLIKAQQDFRDTGISKGACRCTKAGVYNGNCVSSQDSFTAYAYTDNAASACAAGADMPDKASIFDLSISFGGMKIGLNDQCSGNLSSYAHAYAHVTATSCYDTGFGTRWVAVASLTKRTACA